MDELQLKEMIRSLLNEMGGDSAVKETAATDQNKAEKPAVSLQEEVKQDTSVIEDGIIPDITEVDIQEQFLVPNAINEEAYRKIKKFTPARRAYGGQVIATRHKVFCVSVQTMRQLRMQSFPMSQMTLSRKWASFLYRPRQQ